MHDDSTDTPCLGVSIQMTARSRVKCRDCDKSMTGVCDLGPTKGWTKADARCWTEPDARCWTEPDATCWTEPDARCWTEPDARCWTEAGCFGRPFTFTPKTLQVFY